MIRRRKFMALLGGAAAWPIAAAAQQPRNNRKLGVLHPGQSAAVNSRITAIREGLNEAGHQRGSGIELVTRLADGELSRLPALAEDLVIARDDPKPTRDPPASTAQRG